ncbi:uncharacterized protein LOC110456051 isoform X2 [Mizuhopecten yessoensis]|uniref:uncharacterized protein LOC110456051 isoform X2 n=1 Tax=Mizuhopecten yessoensis TaxID=6573 RepID=UPI000B45A5CE|nr:uncharacterized protein LOC110456051 isoform X2 [Mizuhopecten yessoensis]
MATCSKRRVDDPTSGVTATKKRHDYYDGEDELFTTFPKKLIRRLAKHLETLCCEDDYVFKTLRILNCNGADYNGGVPFTKAYCSVTLGSRTLLFGSVFVDGIKMLKAFLKDRHVPTDLQEKRILRKLLIFISDKGNEEVWHGNLDIIVDNDTVGVSYPSECKADSPGGKSTVEVKLKHVNLSRNQQIMSETIVFSFLQKQRHPESRHFLFPCIGVANTGMVVYFYDSQKDVLLESSFISLVSVEGKVNTQAILASWFVVNYKYLSSGIPHSKAPDEKAGFFSHVKEKLEIYEHNLKFGNVGISTSLEDDDSDLEVEPSDFLSETRWELLEIGSMSGSQS